MINCCRKYFLREYGGKCLMVLCLLFFQLLVNGVPLKHLPAMLPMPQSVVWNGSQYEINPNGKWLTKRIVRQLPNVGLNPEEAYSLEINADSAVLRATTPQGLFRGLQTIKQLVFSENGKHFVAGCSITDWPAFRIRGFMQDVGRNYMPLSLLKEQIDVMAAYKFNLFHFHVTDNPGWRLESKKYPQLSKAPSMSRWPGLYYSREEFLELVNYCKDRYITLVPELDVPGHCEAFRKAFALDSMSDPRVQPILLDLIDELCSLVPKEEMPYIHLGTDEVGQKQERPAPGLLKALVEQVKLNGRKAIVWLPGQTIPGDDSSISQLWSSNGKPKQGHAYLDSRLNYLNHLDPLAGITQLYFDRICNKAQGDSLALGGILCCWNDNNVTQPSNILSQNPVYPGMLTYSETSWKGQPVDFGENFLAKLPEKGSILYQEFADFEKRLTAHRDLYFKGKPFPYVRQSAIEWSLIGPFDTKNDTAVIREMEASAGKSQINNGKPENWQGPFLGGTIHINHFFGYPSYFSAKQGAFFAATNIWSPENQEVGCWIGFHDWSRSAGRRGGPFPDQGQWHNTGAKVWLNGNVIAPPVWIHPGLGPKTDEIPFTDENYFFREPTKITLKKGWNQVLLKVPHYEKSWKWMFTFVPVKQKGGSSVEVEGLRFSTQLQLNSGNFKMAPIFGEHMVFQQGRPIQIFGEAGYNDKIKVVFGQNVGNCIADEEGKWKCNLTNLPAGGPYPMQITVNGNLVVDWKDILVGEVWFCSGQSNMEFKLNQAENGKLETSKAVDNQLRLMNFHAVASTSDVVWDSTILRRVNQLDYFEGNWQRNSSAEAASFSAIAYYFGKKLRETLGVPIGLVEVAVGGAPAESFVDRAVLANDPRLSNLLSGWYQNKSVMEWCRQRAQRNCSAGDLLVQQHPYMPSYLFDAGICSFQGFPLKGVIWYQGESNAENSSLYEVLFPELIGSWRRLWQNPKLPFLFAQLSSIQRPGWENFRDSQRRMAQTIPNVAMAVTSDLGDSLNVHPLRKSEVGNRFAMQALQKVYGKSIQADGPLPLKAMRTKNGVMILVDHAEKLGTADLQPIRELEFATMDSIFHPVEGKLVGNKIVIEAKDQNIRFIRYGWKPFSRGNLVNELGLPASTFNIITH